VTPTFTGVHHLKFPVSDLSARITWFETALGATRITHLDHLDRDGNLFAAIMMLPRPGSSRRAAAGPVGGCGHRRL